MVGDQYLIDQFNDLKKNRQITGKDIGSPLNFHCLLIQLALAVVLVYDLSKLAAFDPLMANLCARDFYTGSSDLLVQSLIFPKCW